MGGEALLLLPSGSPLEAGVGPCTPRAGGQGWAHGGQLPTAWPNLRPDPRRVPALRTPPWAHALLPTAQPSLTASPQTEEFFDLIASSQSRRLDDQRASVGSLPGLRITHNNLGHLRGDGDPQEPGDEFFNMLIKCQVGLRLGRRVCVPQAPPSPG